MERPSRNTIHTKIPGLALLKMLSSIGHQALAHLIESVSLCNNIQHDSILKQKRKTCYITLQYIIDYSLKYTRAIFWQIGSYAGYGGALYGLTCPSEGIFLARVVS